MASHREPNRAMVWWGRAYALGTLVHLTLPDYAQSGWLAPQIVSGFGAGLLLWRAHPLGFLLCFLGGLWPLLFLRDVLTQSMLLTWMAVAGLIGCSGRHKTSLAMVVWFTAGTYWLAALHKLNSDFFNPNVSCANHALRQVQARWTWLPDLLPESLIPWLAVLLEVVLGFLLVRRSRWAWPVGVLFHLPLTVTLAPAFGAVMLVGYAAMLSAKQMAQLRTIVMTQWPWLVLSGAIIAFIDAVSADSASPWLAMKCFGFGAIIALFLMGPSRSARPAHLLSSPLLLLTFTLWIAHGMTPYMGIQYQHTGTMLSNLRIDEPCFNSYIWPSAWRPDDPYIRFDHARIGHGQRPKRELALKNGLWSLPALHTMHRNWCVPSLRPIALSGRWQGITFDIPDLCDPAWSERLPRQTRWPGLQGFQKNLVRRCDAACIH